MSTDQDDGERTEANREERIALKLARLPEAKLRTLSAKDLRRAYDVATDPWTSQFLSEENWKRVTDLAIARHLDAPAERKRRKKRKRRRNDGDGYIKF